MTAEQVENGKHPPDENGPPPWEGADQSGGTQQDGESYQQDTAPPVERPYGSAAWWAHQGWSPIPSVVPTEVNRQKKPAIGKSDRWRGVTGWSGIDVDEDIAHMLALMYAEMNVGLRMKRGMIGIDKDAYHDGLVTLAGREAAWGPLPPTIYSTNRDDGSEICYFRCPPELITVGDLGQWGPGVDLIQRHHRFAVVSGAHWSGRQYRIGWQPGCPFPQEPGQVIWRPDQAAELPSGWVQGLRKAARQQVSVSTAVSTAGKVGVPKTSYPSNFSLSGLLKYVEKSEEGVRNRNLFWAGCRAFENPGRPLDGAVTELLRRAASRAGLPDSESLPTIASAAWTVAE